MLGERRREKGKWKERRRKKNRNQKSAGRSGGLLAAFISRFGVRDSEAIPVNSF